MIRHQHDTSQHGESTELLCLFNLIGADNEQYIELGAGNGYDLSNCYLFRQLGWKGISIDIDRKGNEQIIEAEIRLDNIESLLQHTNKGTDLLSIDIDGNDYWILDKILTFQQPRVIIFEINSQLPLDEAIVRPYVDQLWDGSNWFGMSYAAGQHICKQHGYTIYDVVHNTNIIAVRNDIKIKPKPYTIENTWSHPDASDFEWIILK